MEEIYCKELAHVITEEAQNSNDLPSVSWRHWKASDVNQSYSEGLRTRDASGIDFRSDLKA